MKVGVKDFKKAYKHVNIDDIEVCITDFCFLRLSYIFHAQLSYAGNLVNS